MLGGGAWGTALAQILADTGADADAPAVTLWARDPVVAAAIREDAPDLIVLNFANPDMVGHTGVFDAAVQAVEAVDRCAKEVIETALEGLRDQDAIKKNYKTGDLECQAGVGTIEDAVLARIATAPMR